MVTPSGGFDFVPLVWGSPRMQGWRSISALFTTRNAVCDSLALIVFLLYIISLQSGEEPFPLRGTSTHRTAKDSIGKWKY